MQKPYILREVYLNSLAFVPIHLKFTIKSLPEEFVEEDKGYGNRRHPTNQEEKGHEEPARVADGVVIREFIDDKTFGQSPTHEQTQHNAAEGHNPKSSHIVESVEEAAPEEGAEGG